MSKRLLNIEDGVYEVSFSSEYDRGYGTESAADELVIVIEDGEVKGCMACGIHFITEMDCDWEVDLTDEEVLELIGNSGSHK